MNELLRRLGLGDAIVVGVAAMVGAGVFVAFGPAARAAGAWLPAALVIAAVVAYGNATSSARLAALYPASGGTYVYGRQRLGPFWGGLAGWCFVIGKTASCAAMALTVGFYAWPDQAHLVAVTALAAVVCVDVAGVQKSTAVSRVIVIIVVTVLLTVAAATLVSQPGRAAVPGDSLTAIDATPYGVLQAAGLLFFAFAGYARLATLGEEVRDPARTIPRAVPLALGIALGIYAAVAAGLLHALGPEGVAASSAPVAEAAAASRWPTLSGVVRVTAVLAAFGSLLSLLLGVSRTTFAMARDGHLPAPLAAVHERTRVPHVAALAVGAVAGGVAALVDVRGAIGFSSFAVLAYYAIANASALTLGSDEGAPPRLVPWVGLVGCLALAFSLPATSLAAGSMLVAVGAAAVAWRSSLNR